MRTITFLGVWALAANFTLADEPEDKKRLPDAGLKAFVDALASPNKAPAMRKSGGPSRAELPDDWDAAGQRKVWDAWRKLEKAGIRAIPFLIERIDDERYGITRMHGLDTAHYNLSVGQACEWILREIVVPYSRYRDIDSRNRRPWYPSGDKAQLRQWWRTSQGLTHFEIQRAAYDWIIDHDRNSKRGTDRIGLEELVSERDEFVKNGKAVKGDSDWDDPVLGPRK